MEGSRGRTDGRGPATSSEVQWPAGWRVAADPRIRTSGLDWPWRRRSMRTASAGESAFVASAFPGIQDAMPGCGLAARNATPIPVTQVVRLLRPVPRPPLRPLIWLSGRAAASPRLTSRNCVARLSSPGLRPFLARQESPLLQSSASLRAKLRRHAHPAFERHRGRMGRPENEGLRQWRTSAASRRSARNIRARS